MVGSIALAFFARRRRRRHRRAERPALAHASRRRRHRAVRTRRPVAAGRTDRAAWMLPFVTLVTYLGVNWWASWYPGRRAGRRRLRRAADLLGARRDARRARDALVQRRALRAAAVALDPRRALLARALPGGAVNPATGQIDPAFGYVQVMIDYLPVGFRGLLLASFAAAYMTTIATQMNWGSSYIVNDFYRRFISTGATEHALRAASRGSRRSSPWCCRSSSRSS